MPSLGTLQDSIRRFETEKSSKQKLADDLTRSADTHEQSGDEVRAQSDRESAARYQEDADRAGNAAAALMAEMQVREQKVNNVKDELSQLDDQYQKQRKSLENELDKAA